MERLALSARQPDPGILPWVTWLSTFMRFILAFQQDRGGLATHPRMCPPAYNIFSHNDNYVKKTGFEWLLFKHPVGRLLIL